MTLGTTIAIWRRSERHELAHESRASATDTAAGAPDMRDETAWLACG
jgi:hypothetical protein